MNVNAKKMLQNLLATQHNFYNIVGYNIFSNIGSIL